MKKISIGKRVGRPPRTWFGDIMVTRHDEAKQILIRLLYEHAGSTTAVASVINYRHSSIHNLIDRMGLRGLAGKIREERRMRFRLPAA